MKPSRAFLLRRCAGPLLFLLIWAIILGVPRLRAVLLTHAGSDDTLVRWAPYVLPLAKLFPSHEASPEVLTARYPNDARVQAWAVRDQGLQGAQKLEPLMSRFPREAWLHSNYLRFLTSPLHEGRVAGKLGGTLGAIPPEKPANLSRAALERAVLAANEGARLEPGNCYFDVMRAIFLFALRRDAEALQSLREGGRKKRFDDHTTDDARFMIEATELQRPQPFEERLSQVAFILFPHLPHCRTMTRLATWQALQLEQKGNWQGALEIRAALMRIGARMRDNDGPSLTSLVGVAMVNIAWQGGAPRPANLPRDTQASAIFWSKRFAALCRAHARPDLAAEALREAGATSRFFNLLRFKGGTSTYISGIPDRVLAFLGASNWIGLTLLFQLAITFPAWGALSMILWIKRAPGEEKRLGAVLSVSCISALLCVAAFYEASRLVGGINGWSSFFWGYVYMQGAFVDALRWVVALAPLLGGALFCAIATWWRHRRALHETDHTAQNDGSLRLPPLVRVWTTRLLLAMTLLSIAFTVFAQSVKILPPSAPVPDFWIDPAAFMLAIAVTPYLPIYMALVFTAWWIISSLWLLPTMALPLAGSGVKWLRQSLGVTLLLSSMFYLLVLLVSLQARTQVDAAFDGVLRHGEMAMLRSMGTQNASRVR